MKKGMITLFGFIFLLLTIISISAPTHKEYSTYNKNSNVYYQENKQTTNYIKNIDIKFSKTFFIKYENGRSHFRTYTNYNKKARSNKYFDNNKHNPNRRGIYRNLFDSGHKPKSRSKTFFAEFKIKKDINCPVGWKCFK